MTWISLPMFLLHSANRQYLSVTLFSEYNLENKTLPVLESKGQWTWISPLYFFYSYMNIYTYRWIFTYTYNIHFMYIIYITYYTYIFAETVVLVNKHFTSWRPNQERAGLKIKINPIGIFAPKHPVQKPLALPCLNLPPDQPLLPPPPFPWAPRMLSIFQTSVFLCSRCFLILGYPGTSLLPQKSLQTFLVHHFNF